jgi:hypothetical protein
LLNLSDIYPTYRYLCKSVHGSYAITWLYKRDLGNDVFGERIDPQDWHTPLYICYWTLYHVGSTFLESFGVSHSQFLPETLKKEIQDALEVVRSSQN